MPLNIETRTSEDFVPYIKFDAKAGRWFTKEDGGNEVEVRDLTAIFDLHNIKLGWLLFNEGAAPEATWDNGSVAAQPSPKHRRGFCVNLFSPQKIGGLREMRSNSNAAISAIKSLYEQQFENAPEARKGMVPVVTCESVTPVKSKFGTNYEPVLKITKWVPRPDAMPSGPRPTAALNNEVPPPVNSARSPDPSAETNPEEF
jgi:hypothetical protein